MNDTMNDKLWMTSRDYMYTISVPPGVEQKQTAALIEIADNLRIIAALLAEQNGYGPSKGGKRKEE